MNKRKNAFKESKKIQEESKSKNKEINQEINIRNSLSNIVDSDYKTCVIITKNIMTTYSDKINNIMSRWGVSTTNFEYYQNWSECPQINNLDFEEIHNSRKERNNSLKFIYGNIALANAKSDYYEQCINEERIDYEIILHNQIARNKYEQIRELDILRNLLLDNMSNLDSLESRTWGQYTNEDIFHIYAGIQLFNLLKAILLKKQ